MDTKQTKRLDSLRNRIVPVEFISELYGVNLGNSQVHDPYESWLSARRKKPPADGAVDRYHFESFLQANRVEPLKFAAAALGMEDDSLREVLNKLRGIGLGRDYQVCPNLIDCGLEEDLISALPTIRFRTFGDHESFCVRLHDDLEKAIGVEVQPLRCWTSGQIAEYPYRFAKTFDFITLEPLSIRHQALLDLGKPMNLAPDRCSKLFYAQNRDILREFAAGRREPEDWEQYLEPQQA